MSKGALDSETLPKAIGTQSAAGPGTITFRPALVIRLAAGQPDTFSIRFLRTAALRPAGKKLKFIFTPPDRTFQMVRVAMVGLGKMGISHLAIAKSHPDVQLAAVCDSAGYILDVLHKYSGPKIYTDYDKLLNEETLDAVIIATPSRFHGIIVRAALNKGLHVFCEKPFCLDSAEGLELAALAKREGLVNQVGYHYRFVGAFKEAKRLIESGILGHIHHVRAEAFGPVVLRPKNTTWRVQKSEGGGCLYDYASHAIDLVTYLVGVPNRVGGTALNSVFSNNVEDEVYTTFYFSDGATGHLSVNWSDESYRKMSTRLTVWGSNGRLAADRQEVQVYLRDARGSGTLKKGWNIHYAMELTNNLWYYLRGEEYSDQIDHFIQCIKNGHKETVSSFSSAAETDRIISMILADAGCNYNMPSTGHQANRLNVSKQTRLSWES